MQVHLPLSEAAAFAMLWNLDGAHFRDGDAELTQSCNPSRLSLQHTPSPPTSHHTHCTRQPILPVHLLLHLSRHPKRRTKQSRRQPTYPPAARRAPLTLSSGFHINSKHTRRVHSASSSSTRPIPRPPTTAPSTFTHVSTSCFGTPPGYAFSSRSEYMVSARASAGDVRQVVVQSLTYDQVGLVGMVEV